MSGPSRLAVGQELGPWRHTVKLGLLCSYLGPGRKGHRDPVYLSASSWEGLREAMMANDIEASIPSPLPARRDASVRPSHATRKAAADLDDRGSSKAVRKKLKVEPEPRAAGMTSSPGTVPGLRQSASKAEEASQSAAASWQLSVTGATDVFELAEEPEESAPCSSDPLLDRLLELLENYNSPKAVTGAAFEASVFVEAAHAVEAPFEIQLVRFCW